jgi:hypothetical protein
MLDIVRVRFQVAYSAVRRNSERLRNVQAGMQYRYRTI